MAAFTATAIALGYAGFAAAAGDIFENKNDFEKFKAKIKRDVFYTPEEKANMKPPRDDSPEKADEKNLSDGDIKTDNKNMQGFGKEKGPQISRSDENFRVEGIIRISGRGCAIINGKIWFPGKPNFGYELLKVYDEYVEIKTPDGRTIKCTLIKEKTME